MPGEIEGKINLLTITKPVKFLSLKHTPGQSIVFSISKDSLILLGLLAFIVYVSWFPANIYLPLMISIYFKLYCQRVLTLTSHLFKFLYRNF